MQAFHAELMEKEDTMKQLRHKAHQLMQDREHVPGLKEFKKQLKQLGLLIYLMYECNLHSWAHNLFDLGQVLKLEYLFSLVFTLSSYNVR